MAERRWRPAPATLAGWLAGIAVVAVALVAPSSWREPLRERGFDLMLQASAGWRDWSAAPRIAIIDIDAASLDSVGPWPWRRETVARLITAARQAGPAAIAIDILIAGTDSRSPAALARQLAAETGQASFATLAEGLLDGDKALAEAISAGPVALGFVLDPRGDDPVEAAPVLAREGARFGRLWSAEAASAPPPTLAATASGIGTLSLPGDDDGLVRRVPLFVALRGEPLPGLALEALRLASGASGYLLSGDPARIGVGERTLPLPDGGLLRLVPHQRPFRPATIRASRLLDGRADLSSLPGAIVFIGGSAPELGALRPSPRDPLTASSLLQADALRQIATGIVPKRLADAWHWELSAAIVLTMASAWLARRLRPLPATLAMAALLGFGLGGSLLAAAGDVLIDPLLPLAGAGAAFLAAAIGGFSETRRLEARLRQRFSQHLAPGVVERIVADPSSLRLNGERREITSLFTDIEGFSRMTSEIGAEQLVRVLDGYFEGVTRIIVAHGGMVDKFVGDAVHAIFNAPLDLADHPRRAIACAGAILAWTEEHRAQGLAGSVALGRTRIGVETGWVVVGDVGVGAKLDYTAHGDAVNTAARLEALNKELGSAVCIGPAAAARCPELVRPLAEADLRGIGPLRVFTLAHTILPPRSAPLQHHHP